MKKKIAIFQCHCFKHNFYSALQDLARKNLFNTTVAGSFDRNSTSHKQLKSRNPVSFDFTF